MELNPAKMELINGFFENYLNLNESEEKELMEEIKQLNSDESEQILKLPNQWREKGRREGIIEGIREGIREGLQEGRQKGLQEGLQEGRQKGLQEGLQKGEIETRMNIALNMLKEGMPFELIVKLTNLDFEEIKDLSKKLQYQGAGTFFCKLLRS